MTAGNANAAGATGADEPSTGPPSTALLKGKAGREGAGVLMGGLGVKETDGAGETGGEGGKNGLGATAERAGSAAAETGSSIPGAVGAVGAVGATGITGKIGNSGGAFNEDAPGGCTEGNDDAGGVHSGPGAGAGVRPASVNKNEGSKMDDFAE